MTADPWAVENLFQQPDESWDAYLKRIGELYRAAPAVTVKMATGRPATTQATVVSHLSADTWTRAADLALRLGVSVKSLRSYLCRARRRGVPLERSRLGWRLVRTEAAA